MARLQALRQARAQSDPNDEDTRRALSLALAQAIGLALKGSLRADQREELEFEQATALFHGEQFHRAGTLYEQLDRLDLAADCYRRAGSIAELESVHEKQELAKRQAESRAQFEQKLNQAFAAGRRKLVLEQCASLLEDQGLRRKHPQMMTRLSARVRDIRARTPRPQRAELNLFAREQPTQRHTLTLIWNTKVLAGRSPGVELSLADPSLSREHLSIELAQGQVNVCDLGSRTGSFLDGDALHPHEPVSLWPETPYCLGLGMQSSIHVRVLPGAQGVLLANPGVARHWTLFGHGALPLPLVCAIDIDQASPLPCLRELALLRDSDVAFLELTHAAPRAHALSLSDVPIHDPDPLQLLTQDRLEITQEGQSWSLEVLK